MTLPVSGPLSLNAVNVELGFAGTTLISLNQASVRTLAGVPSGTIRMSNLYSATSRVSLTVTVSSSFNNAVTNLNLVSGYIPGKTDFTININSGVYLWGDSSGSVGYYITGGTSGDTLIVNNSGYIIGKGGNGGNAYNVTGEAGSTALEFGTSTAFSVQLNNLSGGYIAAGGGGGGAGVGGGGGGAGGGDGGNGSGGTGAGAGGSIGASGNDGSASSAGRAGGGGGRVLPGVGGVSGDNGNGGGAGGSGGGEFISEGAGGAGGAGGATNSPGLDGDTGPFGEANSGGGGGGWGAAGGAGGAGSAGGAAGVAVVKNGRTVTISNSGAIYGAVTS